MLATLSRCVVKVLDMSYPLDVGVEVMHCPLHKQAIENYYCNRKRESPVSVSTLVRQMAIVFRSRFPVYSGMVGCEMLCRLLGHLRFAASVVVAR